MPIACCGQLPQRDFFTSRLLPRVLGTMRRATSAWHSHLHLTITLGVSQLSRQSLCAAPLEHSPLTSDFTRLVCSPTHPFLVSRLAVALGTPGQPAMPRRGVVDASWRSGSCSGASLLPPADPGQPQLLAAMLGAEPLDQRPPPHTPLSPSAWSWRGELSTSRQRCGDVVLLHLVEPAPTITPTQGLNRFRHVNLPNSRASNHQLGNMPIRLPSFRTLLKLSSRT